VAEIFSPDNLIAGDFPVVTDSATILHGQVLARGTVLGKISASSKCVIVNSTNVDGSQTPFAVLLEAADATADDVPAPIALCGEFNEDSLIFGGSDTKVTHKAAMRALCMYHKAAVSA
jgi:hypothetical protein